jgi:hypothetical protein
MNLYVVIIDYNVIAVMRWAETKTFAACCCYTSAMDFCRPQCMLYGKAVNHRSYFDIATGSENSGDFFVRRCFKYGNQVRIMGYVYGISKSLLTSSLRSRDSSVGIATAYGLDDQGGGSSSPDRVNNFHFSISFRPSLGSTQSPIKWVPGALSRG